MNADACLDGPVDIEPTEMSSYPGIDQALLDLALEIELASITAQLRAAREQCTELTLKELDRRLRMKHRRAAPGPGLTQVELGRRLNVVGTIISDWETNLIRPTLAHLLAWCKALGLRLALIGPDGLPLSPQVERRAGEKWEGREARRILTALRARRRAAGRSQRWTAGQLGMGRVNFNRLETGRSQPLLSVAARWVNLFDCRFAVLSAGDPSVRPTRPEPPAQRNYRIPDQARAAPPQPADQGRGAREDPGLARDQHVDDGTQRGPMNAATGLNTSAAARESTRAAINDGAAR